MKTVVKTRTKRRLTKFGYYEWVQVPYEKTVFEEDNI